MFFWILLLIHIVDRALCRSRSAEIRPAGERYYRAFLFSAGTNREEKNRADFKASALKRISCSEFNSGTASEPVPGVVEGRAEDVAA